MVEDPDRDILERFVRGDGDAFEALFRRFEGEVYRWIVRIVRDPASAEDVLVESFWRAYRARARFDAEKGMGAWMRRIATNASIDHLRGERRRARWSLAPEAPKVPASADPELRKSILAAFRALPPKLQVVAALSLLEDRPLAEIAEALGVPLGTVKSRLSRAGARLRKELARKGIRP